MQGLPTGRQNSPHAQYWPAPQTMPPTQLPAMQYSSKPQFWSHIVPSGETASAGQLALDPVQFSAGLQGPEAARHTTELG